MNSSSYKLFISTFPSAASSSCGHFFCFPSAGVSAYRSFDCKKLPLPPSKISPHISNAKVLPIIIPHNTVYLFVHHYYSSCSQTSLCLNKSIKIHQHIFADTTSNKKNQLHLTRQTHKSKWIFKVKVHVACSGRGVRKKVRGVPLPSPPAFFLLTILRAASH